MDRRRMMMASGTPEPEVERDWLRFDILTAGTVLWRCATDKERTISYRKNGGKWTNITSTTNGVSISVAVGDIVEFKGNNADYGGTTSVNGKGSYFAGTATFNASGDISTMLNNSETLPADRALAHLFNNANVVSAEDLILPYMTLTSACYYGMFYSCGRLMTAPELPATTLADYCYYYMFSGCTNLILTPYKLPATKLKNYCYYQMFSNCTRLTEAPYLPATTLVSNCYSAMFYGCTKLQYIRADFTTTPSASYTYNWVYGVAANGIFDKGSATWNVAGANGVPTNWTAYSGLAFIVNTGGTITWNVDNAGSSYRKTIQYQTNNSSTWINISSSTSGNSFNVEAGTVIRWRGSNTEYGYSGNVHNYFGGTAKFDAVGNIMSLLNDASSISKLYVFSGLFRLAQIVSARYLRLPATTLRNYCYYYMFHSCTSLVEAPKLPATTLADGCYSRMFYGCTSLTKAPDLLARPTASTSCYSNMFYGCTSLIKAPKLSDYEIAPMQCYYGMFYNCISLVEAPELPATTLVSQCYGNMFYGCTSLTKAPELSATKMVSGCYSYMFYGCSNLNKITCLATDISASNCIYKWVYGVAENGTFTKAASMTSWPSGVSGIPENWTVEDYVEE